MKRAVGVVLSGLMMVASAEAKAEGVLRAVGAEGAEGAPLRAVSTAYRVTTFASEATVRLTQLFAGEIASNGRVRMTWAVPEGAVVTSARVFPGGVEQQAIAPGTRTITFEGPATRGTDVEVWIVYRQPLVTTGLHRELHLPVNATPSPGRRLVVSVFVSDTPPLQRIVSPSHTVRIQRPHPREANVELAPGGRAVNREFVLQWERGAPATVGTIGVGGGNGAAGRGFGGMYGLRDASTVRGDLDREPIRRVVAQNLSRFQRCYTDVLTRDASAEGRVLSDVVIGREGQVIEASLVDNAIGDARFAPCVEGVWRSLRFPSATGSVVRLRYPLRFTPGA